MPARRTPRWTRAELAILREHYPLGGMKAVLTLLPGRSWYAVHIKAAKLRALILDRVPVRRAAGIVGRIGGRARAQQQREPFKAKARVLREECGLPASEALSAIREVERT